MSTHSSRLRRQEFRFAVGDQAHIRSTVWKLWTQKANFYVLSRMMGDMTKVSFHSDGKAQFSQTQPWFAKNKPGMPNKLRHMDRWDWKTPTAVNNHIFQISIPSSELRIFSDKENLAKVHWIANPGNAMKTTIDCFLFACPANEVPKNNNNFLAALDLETNTSIVAFVTYSSMLASELQQLQNLHQQIAPLVSAKPTSVQKMLRAAASFIDSEGVRGILELAPFN